MSQSDHTPRRAPVEAIVMDERVVLSVDELGRYAHCRRELIVTLVHEGVLAPAQPGPEDDWRFDLSAGRRARRAVRLMHDLELNLPGVALALDLLDQIDALKQGMHR